MKYMGSKRSMLKNGLGKLLLEESKGRTRVVDLFSGSGSVSWFVSTNVNLPVFALDLQSYAATLAAAVIERSSNVNVKSLIDTWLIKSINWAQQHPTWNEVISIDSSNSNAFTWSKRSRDFVSSFPINEEHVVTSSYGGHYFSLTQSLLLDGMLNNLPSKPQQRKLCHAATIIAASCCSASPGHTAQPFQPTKTASKYIQEAWSRDPVHQAKRAIIEMSHLRARKKGKARVGDAMKLVPKLNKEDLVFIDPPYSDVQYSRFYHVLETIARRKLINVSGVGRYPPFSERPVSQFSRKSESYYALQELLQGIALVGADVILTFPSSTSSNGLSGQIIKQVARKWFSIKKHLIKTRFSSLGGNNNNRRARIPSEELILVLKPK